MATPTPTSAPIPGAVLTVEDRLDIDAVLADFAAGIDENDPATLGAVFTADATLDFGPAARATGIDFPVLDGRQGIVDGVAVSVGPMDTVHIATTSACSTPRATAPAPPGPAGRRTPPRG